MHSVVPGPSRTAILIAALIALSLHHPVGTAVAQSVQPSVAPGGTGAIEGRVTAVDGSPLTGANVQVRGTMLGAATDEAGRYRIPHAPAGARVLRCSMLGYRTAEKPVQVVEGGIVRADVALVASEIHADEVTVTAGRRPQSLEEVPVSVAIMGGREIEARGIVSLDQALRTVPGVNMTESQINVRGSSGYNRGMGTRVLLLVDGVPMVTGDANEVKLDAIPFFAIDRIEVVKGAGSALYGSSALGGVVNVITREPSVTRTHVRLMGGMWDAPAHPEWKWWGDARRLSGSIDALHEGVAGPMSYRLSGAIRGDASYMEGNDANQWNAGGAAIWRPTAESRVQLNGEYYHTSRDNWVYWRDVEHALQRPVEADLSERVVSNKMSLAAQYRNAVGERFTHRTRVSLYRTDFDTFSDTSDYQYRPNDKTQSDAWALGAEWQATYLPGANHVLTAGVDGTFNTAHSRTFGEHQSSGVALYAQDDAALGAQWSATAGARLDIITFDGTHPEAQVSPRLGAAWNPITGTTARASCGWGFRAPSIAERYTTASAGSLLTKPNPDLLPERSISWEVGVKQDLMEFAQIDVAGFVANYWELVEPVLDPTDARISFRNITRARILGAEAGLRVAPFEKLGEIMIGYTYMDPRDLTLDEELKYRPRHIFLASVTGALGPLAAGADYRFISRIENIDDELVLIVPDAGMRVPTHVLNLRLSWDARDLGLPLRVTALADNVLRYMYVEIPANVAEIRRYRLMVESMW
jgi:outer membrane receptor for ferrienterochelin and colicins